MCDIIKVLLVSVSLIVSQRVIGKHIPNSALKTGRNGSLIVIIQYRYLTVCLISHCR